MSTGTATGLAAGPRPAAAPHGPASSGHIPVLDGLRAVSIGLVLVGHVLAHRNRGGWPGLVDFADQMAWFGVNVFFVISGYLITLLLIREEARYGSISLRQFYIRRALRILPASYTFLAVVVMLAAAGIVENLPGRDVLLSVFYLRNMAGRNFETAHLWSLSLEEQFYLIWPGVVVLVAGRGRRLGVLWAALVIFAAWRAFLIATGWTDYVRLYMWPDQRMDTILVGCGLALLAGGPRFERLSRAVLERGWFAAAAAVALIAWLGWGRRLLWSGVVLWTTTAALTTALVHWLLRNPDAPGVGLLRRPSVQFVGRLSYSLYLWQQLFLIAPTPRTEAVRRFPVDFLLTVACALASYYAVERPFLALKDRYFKRPTGGARPAGGVAPP